jgi:hypothetical protein
LFAQSLFECGKPGQHGLAFASTHLGKQHVLEVQRERDEGDLTLTSAPIPNQAGVFFHGASQGNTPFGCGFLCAATGTERGAVVVATGNSASYTYDNSNAKHDLGGFVGTTRNFQHWYRDPLNAGACGDTFNTSNAISIGILP